MQRIEDLGPPMLAAEDQQLSLTDPDARAMKGRGGNIVAYNVQTAVEPTHHLIVAHEVITTGSDRDQLANMAKQAREAMGTEALAALADRGYYKCEEILACEQAGITTYLPRSETSGNQAKGLFGERDFRYLPGKDVYQCPAGEYLPRRTKMHERGQVCHRYWSSNCRECVLKARCTTGKERRVSRWEHETVLDAAQARRDRQPKAMLLRRQTVEHPFGTMKTWMGYSHLLTKTLPRVKTEMSLRVLAYNLRRVMSILGAGALLEAVRA